MILKELRQKHNVVLAKRSFSNTANNINSEEEYYLVKTNEEHFIAFFKSRDYCSRLVSKYTPIFT